MPVDRFPDASSWVIHFDYYNRPYFVNLLSKSTQWSDPTSSRPISSTFFLPESPPFYNVSIPHHKTLFSSAHQSGNPSQPTPHIFTNNPSDLVPNPSSDNKTFYYSPPCGWLSSISSTVKSNVLLSLLTFIIYGSLFYIGQNYLTAYIFHSVSWLAIYSMVMVYIAFAFLCLSVLLYCVLFIVPLGCVPFAWLCCGCSPCLQDTIVPSLRSPRVDDEGLSRVLRAYHERLPQLDLEILDYLGTTHDNSLPPRYISSIPSSPHLFDNFPIVPSHYLPRRATLRNTITYPINIRSHSAHDIPISQIMESLMEDDPPFVHIDFHQSYELPSMQLGALLTFQLEKHNSFKPQGSLHLTRLQYTHHPSQQQQQQDVPKTLTYVPAHSTTCSHCCLRAMFNSGLFIPLSYLGCLCFLIIIWRRTVPRLDYVDIKHLDIQMETEPPL